MSTPHFTDELFEFLRDLAENNEREWFQANKARYEEHLKEPALRFISDFGPALAEISPHFQAIPKAVGGSLFRIYRDTRFSKNKTPYKTHLGIQFRHKRSRDAHAPGFYVHLEPDRVFLGAGAWRPATPALRAIREAIAVDPEGWRRAVGGSFGATFELEGDALVRVPRGFDADHPLVDDLRRKDFIGVARLGEEVALTPELLDVVAGSFRAAGPFMAFLCGALGVEYAG